MNGARLDQAITGRAGGLRWSATGTPLGLPSWTAGNALTYGTTFTNQTGQTQWKTQAGIEGTSTAKTTRRYGGTDETSARRVKEWMLIGKIHRTGSNQWDFSGRWLLAAGATMYVSDVASITISTNSTAPVLSYRPQEYMSAFEPGVGLPTAWSNDSTTLGSNWIGVSITRAGATSDPTIGALIDRSIESTAAYWYEGAGLTTDPWSVFPTQGEDGRDGWSYDYPIGVNPEDESVGGSGSTIDPEVVGQNPDLGAWGSQLQTWLNDTVAGLPDFLSIFSMFGTFLGIGD